MGCRTYGELCAECLTSSSAEKLIMMYSEILRLIENCGYITICDIAAMAGKGVTENWKYASTHGWNRFDVSNFEVKYCKDGNRWKWHIFLGNPRTLTDSKRNQPACKKYIVLLSHKKPIPPEDEWDVALDRIRLYVNAENTKAAREMAVEAMEAHHLYCKVVYIRKLKGETK